MASHQLTGQSQVPRDEMQMKQELNAQQQPDYHHQMDQLSNSAQSNSLLQQTGEQVKTMAQGAANAATGAARGAVNMTQGAATGAANMAQSAASGAANIAQSAASGAANMAQGATDAVKNTLGINNPTDSNPNPNSNTIPPTSSANHPSNPHPANPNTRI